MGGAHRLGARGYPQLVEDRRQVVVDGAHRPVQTQRDLIAREMDHRVKNSFAVLAGLVSAAAADHPEAADFAEDVRGHDLRRTAASGMGRLGVARETIALVLNHVDRGPRATAVYDRFDRLPEKRAALDRWAREVARIVTPTASAKVVAIAG